MDQTSVNCRLAPLEASSIDLKERSHSPPFAEFTSEGATRSAAARRSCSFRAAAMRRRCVAMTISGSILDGTCTRRTEGPLKCTKAICSLCPCTARMSDDGVDWASARHNVQDGSQISTRALHIISAPRSWPDCAEPLLSGIAEEKRCACMTWERGNL